MTLAQRLMSSSGGESEGGESEGGEMVVFDLDKMGFRIFDPNDDDMGTGHGMDIGFGLSINLVNDWL